MTQVTEITGLTQGTASLMQNPNLDSLMNHRWAPTELCEGLHVKFVL